MNGLDKAIKRTLEYGERFGVKYTADEVKERLISSRIYKKLLITNYKLLIKNEKDNNYLVKLSKAKKLAEIIDKKFPSVLFVGVTGSVAAGYPKENSDIDLMIVTKLNSLWLTRLILRIWVWWNKIPHRRYGTKENKNEFCFNLWLEEDSLLIPKNKQNLRNAMDTILMKPILNKNGVYENFLRKNEWVKSFVANGYHNLITNTKLPPQPPLVGGTRFFLNIFLDYFWLSVNWLVFWPQWWYMKQKIGTGLVDKKRAFFHPV